MYRPRHFHEEDADKLHALIAENPFGVLITVVDERPFASHIPFIYERQNSILLGHVARANPQWQHFSNGQPVMAIFQGPHAYVSPTWYVDPGVPTWNYAVVHIYGAAKAIEDRSKIQEIIERLTERQEHRSETPWVPRYDERLLNAIVGIEIVVSEVQGKFKLGQNRSAVDRASVISKLTASGSEANAALAKLMSGK